MISEVLHPPNEQQRAAIIQGIREDPIRLNHCTDFLERWLQHQNHMSKAYDRRMLHAYIRGCKYDLEKAKRKIERLYISRRDHKDLYENRILTLEGDLHPSTYIHFITMPNFTDEGCRVTVTKFTDQDISKLDPLVMMRFVLLIAELRIHEDNFMRGEVFVFDFEGVTKSLIAKLMFSIRFFARILILAQDAYPLIVKQVHIVTDKMLVETTVNMFKRFAKEKIRNRFHVHKTYQSLSNFLPDRCIPSDFGGAGDSLDELNLKWRKVIVYYAPLFEKMNELKLIKPL